MVRYRKKDGTVCRVTSKQRRYYRRRRRQVTIRDLIIIVSFIIILTFILNTLRRMGIIGPGT